MCILFPINSPKKGLCQGYLQGKAAEHVVYIITAYWKEERASNKVAKSNLKYPELRQWSLPATCVLLHQLEKGGET